MVLVAAVGLAVFQPWKLFVDVTVGEAAPADATVVSSSEAFETYDHETTGTVQVLTSGAKTYVRLEDLRTSNGPDVVVYLSAAPASGPEAAFEEEPVNLGSLKGNVGDQNYEVPEGTDLDRYRTVVIWCRRFSVAFAAAPLSGAG